jgi:hypothetical protein
MARPSKSWMNWREKGSTPGLDPLVGHSAYVETGDKGIGGSLRELRPSRIDLAFLRRKSRKA